MSKSLEEVYSKIQSNRLEERRIETARIDVLKLIKERQMHAHRHDMNMYSGMLSRTYETNAYMEDEFIDDYFV